MEGRLFPSASSFSRPLLLLHVNEFQINGIHWSLQSLSDLISETFSPLVWPPWCLPDLGLVVPSRSWDRPDFSSALALHLILNGPLMKPLILNMKQSSSPSLQHQYFTTYAAPNLAKGTRMFMFQVI